MKIIIETTPKKGKKMKKDLEQLVEENIRIANKFNDILDVLQETLGLKSKNKYISFEFHDRIEDEKD